MQQGCYLGIQLGPREDLFSETSMLKIMDLCHLKTERLHAVQTFQSGIQQKSQHL